MHDRQSSGYRVLGDWDKQADASHFAEFILGALLETVKISNASDSVSDPVAKLVGIFKPDDDGALAAPASDLFPQDVSHAYTGGRATGDDPARLTAKSYPTLPPHPATLIT